MALDAVQVGAHVASQLGQIKQRELLDAITPLLVPPRCELRPWDYGSPEEAFPCWIVLEHAPSNTCIAYSEMGFGPRCPWRLLWTSGPSMNMGPDSSWYTYLEDAFRESFAREGQNPEGYEVR